MPMALLLASMFGSFAQAADWQSRPPLVYLDLTPGAGSALCGGGLEVGGVLLFFWEDESHGCELWALDSMTDEPRLFYDICPGECSSDPNSFTRVGDRWYFLAAPSEGSPDRLWVTDGTAEGTYQVAEIAEADPRIDRMTPVGDNLYFNADDGVHGLEVWRSDGTELGTYMLKDANPGPEERANLEIVDMGAFRLFKTWTTTHGTELWRTDGTDEGTQLVTEILPGPQTSALNDLQRFGDIVLFSAYTQPYYEELWMSDGTAEGTTLLKEINSSTVPPSIKGSSPREFIVIRDFVLFSATTNEFGTELWRTDGTADGTWMVKDIDTRPFTLFQGASAPTMFHEHHGKAVFWARDSSGVREVWISDGTEAGTYAITDSSSVFNNRYKWNGFLYFTGSDYMRIDANGVATLVAERPPGYLIAGGLAYLDGVLITAGSHPNSGRELYALNIPPWVESITPETASPTDLQEASFLVRFNEAVDGVTPGDFTLSGSGIFEPAVTATEAVGEGREWRVTVDTGAGDGTLYLRLNDDDSIVDAFGGLPLEGYGIADGSFTSETGLMVDKAAPTVVIATTGPNPILNAPIPVQVTFERPVTGVSAQDFLIGNATLSNFSGSGADYSFELTPLDFGEVTARVPANICVDEGQIPNAPSNVLVVQFQAPPEFHTADTTQDRLINLSELLRVVQLFNAHLVTGNPEGMFYCDPEEKEDGYLLLPAGAHQDCAPHASDYKPQDWRINLSELLRVIQFFNSAGYHWCNDAAKEGDGYCAGPGEG
jgi:ELWxxDGT repeat protein